MKKVNGIEQEKEVFRLWVEYLKRSDDYKDFCEWVAKKRKNKKLPPPDKFKRGNKKEVSNYFRFGPIHDPRRWTFEEWWAMHKEALTYRQANSSPRPVEDYLKLIGKDIDSCVESFKRHEGREPNLQEFKDYFLKWLMNVRNFSSFFMINNSQGKEVIEAEFKKMLKERKKYPLIKGQELDWKRWYLPSTNYTRMDELKRHLRIYDQWDRRIRINEIIKTDEYYKKRREKDDVARRLIYMDIAKAKKIIRNVEFGIFPGKYEGVKARIR